MNGLKEVQEYIKNSNNENDKRIIIDNSIAERLRKIRILGAEIEELKEKYETQVERNAKYQLQKQEFYVRFGRMPQLSEQAEKTNQLQEKQSAKSVLEIGILKKQVKEIESEVALLLETTKELEKETEIHIEEITIGEVETIEDIYVEQFEPIEEIYVEEFKPIEEIQIPEFKEEELFHVNEVKHIQESAIKEIENLARAIVEEIVAEQTKDYIMEKQTKELEKEVLQNNEIPRKIEKKEKVIIPLFGQRAKISNIIIKFEEKELVYTARMNNGEEVKIYPSQLGEGSVILRDKLNREDCREILKDYAASQNKVFDNKIIKLIDPLVCELLIECANKYGFNAQELIYNYAESFADAVTDPGIIYNLSYIEQSNLNTKEKAIIRKICRKARLNDGIDIIESFTGFNKIKYALKRLFAINNVKLLPEAKY